MYDRIYMYFLLLLYNALYSQFFSFVFIISVDFFFRFVTSNVYQTILPAFLLGGLTCTVVL